MTSAAIHTKQIPHFVRIDARATVDEINAAVPAIREVELLTMQLRILGYTVVPSISINPTYPMHRISIELPYARVGGLLQTLDDMGVEVSSCDRIAASPYTHTQRSLQLRHVKAVLTVWYSDH